MKGDVGMSASGLETVTESKPAQPSAEPRSPRATSGTKGATEPTPPSRRRRNRRDATEPSIAERFFLAGEPNADRSCPSLGREVPNEGEAIVEAFRAGVTFFAVSEFRTRAEISPSRDPLLKKEAVKGGNHSS
jgi:hypothetical protein